MKAYVVDKARLVRNIQTIREAAGDTPIWGVLKGNGYGLGLLPMAKLLRENGVDRFAVTEVKEAEQLRENGFETEPILMLRSYADPGEINLLLDLNVILTVGSWDTAQAVNEIAGARAAVAEIHLKLDTGMGRYGFLPEELDKLEAVYRELKNLAVTGIYTHFHSAFCSERATKLQYATFTETVQKLQEAGLETGMIHCCNSAAFLRHPGMREDAIRIGSAFLGRVAVPHDLDLQPVGYGECAIEEIRWLPKGHTVGYGAGWRAKTPTRIAVIGIGYYHGFTTPTENDLFRLRDSLRGILHHVKNIFVPRYVLVTVNGVKCRVLGHIGMVGAVIDVTDVECRPGDRVRVEINPLHVKGLKIQYR